MACYELESADTWHSDAWQKWLKEPTEWSKRMSPSVIGTAYIRNMGDAVQMDKAGILEIADLFIINKADFAGESKLKRELLDIASGREIYETIATQGQGIVELLDALLG